MILITGAGGTVGSEVVKQLQSLGAPFRAAYHSEDKAAAARARGIDAVVIDYTRPQTLTAALDGIDRVFLLSGGAPDQTQRELNVVEAAKNAGVKHIVKLSVIDADTESYSFANVHRPVEKAIEASGMAWTHLCPNGFMQNLSNYMIGTIRDQGAFYSSLGEAKVSHVDVRDIAAVAANVLTESGHEGKAYTLTGPEGLTYAEIASKISTVLGRDVKYVNVSDDAIKDAAFADLLRFYRTGAAGRVSDDVRRVTGRDATSFDEYARDYFKSI